MRKLYTFVVAVADIILLVMIINSVRSAASTGHEMQDLSDAQTVYETTSVGGTAHEEAIEESLDEAREEVIDDTIEKVKEETEVRPAEDVSSEDGNAEDEGSEKSREEPGDEGRTGLIGKIKTGNRGENGSSGSSDPADHEAADYPDRTDFQWVTADVLYGSLPVNLDALSFAEIPGTWKGYIITDPENTQNAKVEQYVKVVVSGTQDNTEIILDWYYTFVESEEKGYDDNALDSVFSGSMENGKITAYGPGMLELTHLWLADGKQYASGTLSWPDGMPAVIFMVRP